jgi:hypothetical protein
MWWVKRQDASYVRLIKIYLGIITAFSHGKNTKAISLDDCFW